MRRSTVAGLVWVALLACDSSDVPAPASGDSLSSRRVSEGMRVVQTQLNHASWVLEADEAVHDPELDVTNLTTLKVTFFGKDGQVSSILTSERGVAEGKTRHLVAKKNVVVETPEGYRLETETLRWDDERERILSDDPVRIRQFPNLYTGVGLVSDPELKEFEILTDFRATVIAEPSVVNPDPNGTHDATGN